VNRFPLISLFFPGILGESETSDDASSDNSNLNRSILEAQRRLPRNQESSQPPGFTPACGSYPNRRFITARRRLPHSPGNGSQENSLVQLQRFEPAGFTPRVQSGEPNLAHSYNPNMRFFTPRQQLPQSERNESFQPIGFTPRFQSASSNLQYQNTAAELARLHEDRERLLGEWRHVNDLINRFQPEETSPGQGNRSQPPWRLPFQNAPVPSGLFGFQPQGNAPVITPQPPCSFSFQPRPSPAQPLFGEPAQGNSSADIFQPRNQSTPMQRENPPPVVELSTPEAPGVTVTYTDSAGQTREISLSQARELAGSQVNAREYPALPGIHHYLITDSDDSG